MAEAEKSQAAAEEQVTELTFLEQVLGNYDAFEVQAEEEKRKIERAVTDLSVEVLKGLAYSRDIESSLDALIREIDARVSEQTNEILHHPKFQKLEASWRGLMYLLEHSTVSDQLQIKVMSLSKDELVDDLTAGAAAANVDRSRLFRRIYQEEYNTFGGTPFGAVISDYEFGPSGRDMKLLGRWPRSAPWPSARSSRVPLRRCSGSAASPRSPTYTK